MNPTSRQPSASPIPNPHANHRRQSFWQIGLPLGASALIAVALAVLVALATAQHASHGVHWASISLIVLILPLYVAGMLVFALTILMIVGIAKLYRILPIYTLKIRSLLYRIGTFTMINSNRLVQPLIALRGGWAGLQRLAGLIRMRKTAN